MKNKNLFLGLAAFIFAVGTSFASFVMPAVNAYVLAQELQGDTFVCRQTDQQCDQSGTASCFVTLTKVQSPGSETVRARSITDCDPILTHANASPIGAALVAGFTPYDIQ